MLNHNPGKELQIIINNSDRWTRAMSTSAGLSRNFWQPVLPKFWNRDSAIF